MEINPFYEKIITDLIQHDYALVDGFFEESLCVGLKEILEQKMQLGAFKRANIGSKVNVVEALKIRSDKILWIDNPSENKFERAFNLLIENFFTYLNHTCYTGIRGSEFHYALFEKGAFYKRHLDRFSNDQSRKFSMVTYLNQDRKADDGGALLLYTDHGIITILPEWGRMVIFKSDVLEHEVLVSKKDRLSLTGWLK